MYRRFCISGLAPVALVALYSYPAFAGPPKPFDGWSVSNGGVAASCGTGFQCTELSSGPGFLQRNVENAAGQVFVQTIVTGAGASGIPAAGLDFSDESFIKVSATILGTGTQIPGTPGTGSASNTAGIADKQALHSESITSAQTRSFDSLVMINRGWAAESGKPSIDILQKIVENTSAGQSFSDTAHIAGNNDSDGLQTGTLIELSSSFSQPSLVTSSTDIQKFELRRIGGDLLVASGSATLPGSSRVNWSPGQVIQTMWIGQRLDFEGDAEGGTLGFQSFDNLSDNSSQTTAQSTSSAGPFTWPNPPFGTAPTMPGGSSSGGGSSGGGSGGWGGGGGGW